MIQVNIYDIDSSLDLATNPIDTPAWRGGGFGLALTSAQPLLAPTQTPRCGEPLELRHVSAEALRSAWEEPSTELLWRTRFPDGAVVTVERGAEDEHRVRYSSKALYELSADRRLVRWALDGDETPTRQAAAQRFLLDTVLWWTALSRGFELLHASAVKLANGRLVAVVGPSGCGKTSLAIALMGHGATLFADDVLALRRENSGVLAYPGPALMNVPDASREQTQDWAKPIAPFAKEHETWMAVDRAAPEPASLSAVIALDRYAENALELLKLTPSPLTLMGYSWGLTNTGAGAQRGFETFADLAESVASYHLSAQADASPEVIAKLILDRCA